MTFEVQDYYDFVRLLYQHPDWQEELGNLLIAREIRELPQIVRELAEAQKRTDEQLWILTQRVDELAEAQKRTEQRVEELAEAQKRTDEQLRILTQRMDELTQRVDALTQRMDELTQRVDALTQRVDELAEAQKRTDEQLRILTQRMDELTQRVDTLTQRVNELAEAQKTLTQEQVKMRKQLDDLIPKVGQMWGDTLEVRYRQRIFSYFGRIASRIRVIDLQEIWDNVTPYLSEEEQENLLELDLLATGKLKESWKEKADFEEFWLAVEVSGKVNQHDVERACERANLLRKTGWAVLAVAAGREAEEGVDDLAQTLGVILQTDGRMEGVESALKVARTIVPVEKKKRKSRPQAKSQTQK